MLTQERLKELLHYDPETGVFTRLKRAGNAPEGEPVRGCPNHAGYLRIMIDLHSYRAHRLAWLYVHGKLPKEDLDHINGDKGDNRLANLREATRSQNNMNSGAFKGNSTGYRGVVPNGRKFSAQICIAGKSTHIGNFDTPEEARAAYLKRAFELHGEYVRVA